MRQLNKTGAVLVGLFWMIATVKCLFEDQVGTYDWRQQHVGRPRFSHIDYASKKLFVGSDQNLLGSLNIKSGKIAWRKIFESNENGKIDHVLWGTKEILVVTGSGQRIQSFNYVNGFVNWEYQLFNKKEFLNKKFVSIESKRENENFYLTDGKQLCQVGFKEKICVDLPTDGGYLYENLYETSKGVFVIGYKEKALQKIQYNFLLSSIISKTISPQNGQLDWLNSKTSCSKAANLDQIVCFSNEQRKFYVQKPDNQIVFNEYDLPNELTGNFKLVWSSNDKYVLEFNDQVTLKDDFKNIKLVLLELNQANILIITKQLESIANYNIKAKEENVFVVYAKYNNLNELSFNVLSLTNEERTEHVVKVISNTKEPKGIIQFNTDLVETKAGQMGLLTFCFFSDYSMSIFSTQGVKYFSREEALAYISSVEMIDFPLLHLQEEFEDEFGNSQHCNIISMFVKRIRAQVFQLKEFVVNDLYNKLINFINNNNPNKRLVNSKTQAAHSTLLAEEISRDAFNLNKIIVVATTVGKVFGIYTSSDGRILWSFYLKNTVPFQLNKALRQTSVLLFLQRTTAHYPHEPQAVFVSKLEPSLENSAAKTRVFYFNPLSGQPSKEHPNGLTFNYDVKQAFLSSIADPNNFLKSLILLDHEMKMHVFPENSLPESNKLNVVYTVTEDDKMNSLLTGYKMSYTDKALPEIWRINIEDESIIAIGAKLPNDRIHSHGKVLGDRSVLYKYLNPSVIGVVTTGQDSQKVPFVNVYLIDTVTGSVINSFNHKRCKGPVNIVHSENWFFYSYYNIKFRRFEVTSVELFEGSTQFNSTSFSSLDNIKPIFYSKSYIVQKSFTSMQVTLTEKGITTKDVIVACQSGTLIEIPWVLIDPRRPMKMTEVEKEENLLPYMPEIPLNYEFSLNYYNYVYNVRGILTAPSGLESTSLVFVYGLDIYFTRVFPSKTFDLLREDFDYLFVTLLMIGLLLGTFLSKKLASSSNLQKAWK